MKSILATSSGIPKPKFWALIAFLLGTAAVSAQTHTLVASLGEGFRSESASVNGTSLHYVRGGSGPAILLVHGFPEDWYEFHHIMPVLGEEIHRHRRRFTWRR